MDRPKADHRPLFVDELYLIIVGERPEKDRTLREVMEEVMSRWDHALITMSADSRRRAQIGLCYIGLKCHTTDNLTFTFEQVAQRLSEISPDLQGAEVRPRTMRDILTLHKLSTQPR